MNTIQEIEKAYRHLLEARGIIEEVSNNCESQYKEETKQMLSRLDSFIESDFFNTEK